MTSTETPTGVYHSWFPATVQIGEKSFIRTARVYLTPDGLVVFKRKPEDGATPDTVIPVDFTATEQPRRTTVTAMNGYKIVTATGGEVTVHAEGHCGCGNPLKKWVPEFAGTQLPWPVTA